MKVTKYDYEPVNAFWQKMRTVAGEMQKSIETNLVRWQAADAACEGAPAVTSAVTYLTNAKAVADTIVEAAEAGYRLNEEYNEQLHESVKDLDL